MNPDQEHPILYAIALAAESEAYVADFNSGYIAVWDGKETINLFNESGSKELVASIHNDETVRLPTESEAVERMEELIYLRKQVKNNEQVNAPEE